MGHHAGLVLSGKGVMFFNNNLLAVVSKFAMSAAFAEVVGRSLGKVKNVDLGDEDVTFTVRCDAYREEAARYFLAKKANSRASLTSCPALGASANIAIGERIALLGSGVACTLNHASAASIELFKRDLSAKYTQNTDYTVTTSQITRIGAGSISSGQEVLAFYQFPDASATRIKLGTGVGPLIGRVDISFVNSVDGKVWQFSATKVAPVGAVSIAIAKGEAFAPMEAEWRVISDESDAAIGEYGDLVRSSVAVKSF